MRNVHSIMYRKAQRPQNNGMVDGIIECFLWRIAETLPSFYSSEDRRLPRFKTAAASHPLLKKLSINAPDTTRRPKHASMNTPIHKTAIIDPNAQIDEAVSIGAYTIIGPNVSIGAHSKIGPHVIIDGYTTIGCNNRIFQFASIGEMPQDKKYHGEKAELVMGNNNIIREYCSINIGTDTTIIGNDNYFMMNVHIAHDCRIGSDIVFVNGIILAGHVEVRDHAILSASTKIHQFCRIGEYSFCRDASISQDVAPYVIVIGAPSPKTYGLNKIGLKRHDFSKELIDVLHRCYMQLIRKHHKQDETIQRIDVDGYAAIYPEVKNLINFIKSSKRGIVR